MWSIELAALQAKFSKEQPDAYAVFTCRLTPQEEQKQEREDDRKNCCAAIREWSAPLALTLLWLNGYLLDRLESCQSDNLLNFSP